MVCAMCWECLIHKHRARQNLTLGHKDYFKNFKRRTTTNREKEQNNLTHIFEGFQSVRKKKEFNF